MCTVHVRMDSLGVTCCARGPRRAFACTAAAAVCMDGWIFTKPKMMKKDTTCSKNVVLHRTLLLCCMRDLERRSCVVSTAVYVVIPPTLAPFGRIKSVVLLVGNQSQRADPTRKCDPKALHARVSLESPSHKECLRCGWILISSSSKPQGYGRPAEEGTVKRPLFRRQTTGRLLEGSCLCLVRYL